MRIAEVKHIEDCFDGSFLHEILFDGEITRDVIQSLGSLGELHYYPTFARPFFRVVVVDRFMLKGVEGNRTVRVLSHERDLERTLEHIRESISVSDQPDATTGSDSEIKHRDVNGNCVIRQENYPGTKVSELL